MKTREIDVDQGRHRVAAGLAGGVAAALVLLMSSQAHAVPAFARKYQTSCTTCHTIFPKLNPFGEAFRRNGFRFPGVDSDYWKQDTVALGQETYKKVFPKAVWPGNLLAGAPIAVGFNGEAVLHPDKNSSAGKADGGTTFTMQDLVGEGQVWAAGSLSDSTTYFGELAFSADGVELEHAFLWFNDLAGPAHAANLIVGKSAATLSSFGPHSTYLADGALPAIGVTAAFGGQSDPFILSDPSPRLELNGVIGHRLDYSAGLMAGATEGVHNTQDVYAHAGYKIGGMDLDGGTSGTTNASRPWEENAFTIDAYGARAVSHYIDAGDVDQKDTTLAFGGGFRGQLGSLELDGGVQFESHDKAGPAASKATALTDYEELSYVVYPWLVPAVRFEFVQLSPDGGNSVNDWRIMPGLAALIFPNVKMTVVGWIEAASGAPDGGWEAVGGQADTTGTTSIGPEIEGINIGLLYAY